MPKNSSGPVWYFSISPAVAASKAPSSSRFGCSLRPSSMPSITAVRPTSDHRGEADGVEEVALARLALVDVVVVLVVEPEGAAVLAELAPAHVAAPHLEAAGGEGDE